MIDQPVLPVHFVALLDWPADCGALLFGMNRSASHTISSAPCLNPLGSWGLPLEIRKPPIRVTVEVKSSKALYSIDSVFLFRKVNVLLILPSILLAFPVSFWPWISQLVVSYTPPMMRPAHPVLLQNKNQKVVWVILVRLHIRINDLSNINPKFFSYYLSLVPTLQTFLSL